jgi:predicted HTH transcriptional regulator
MADNDPALIDLIQHRREERNIEYKGSNAKNPGADPFAWGPDAVNAKIARTAIAMANIGGGAIVIGMDQVGPDEWEASGVSPEVATSYQQDRLQQYVNQRADPYVELTVRKPELGGKTFVVIQVTGFTEMPVVCTGGSGELRQGAVYTRSRTKHETVVVQSQTEMRELLDRAIAVGVEKQLRPLVDALRQIMERGVSASAESQFQAERGPEL